MNLLNLAPDIQEEILLCHGPKIVTETQLRRVASKVSWVDQRGLWSTMTQPEQ
jgi:hypothetical protein